MTLYPYTHATYVPQEDVIEEGVPNPPEPHAGLPAMQMELVTQVKSVRNLPNLRDGGNGSHYMVELSFMGNVQRTTVTERNETFNHVHFKERFSFAVHEMTISLARAAKSSGCDGPTLVVSVYDCGRCGFPVPSICVAMRNWGLHHLPVRAACAKLCSLLSSLAMAGTLTMILLDDAPLLFTSYYQPTSQSMSSGLTPPSTSTTMTGARFVAQQGNRRRARSPSDHAC